MDMTPNEAFRLGFITRCAEEGLNGDQLQQRIKLAAEKKAYMNYILPTLLLGGGLTLASRAPGMTGTAIGLPAAAGLGIGAGLGYGAAKVTEPNISADDIKAMELADTYKIYAARAQANRKAQKYRQSRSI
jgi:hypothetical protein